MSAISVDSIVASFPNPSIEKSDEEPAHNLIKKVEKLIIANASSMRSELGGGLHRCLGLVLDPAKHASITSHDFVPHSNTCPLPTFPEAPAQPLIAQVNATHK